MAQTLINNLIIVTKSSSFSIDTPGLGKFIGYKDPTNGFKGSFQILKNYADEKHLPIVIIWAKHDSSNIQSLLNDLNDGTDYTGANYTLQLLNQLAQNFGNPVPKQINRIDGIGPQPGYGLRNGWFQGYENTSSDCAEARQFCIECGCQSSLDLMVALYWKCLNGKTIITQCNTSVPQDESTLMKLIVLWLTSSKKIYEENIHDIELLSFGNQLDSALIQIFNDRTFVEQLYLSQPTVGSSRWYGSQTIIQQPSQASNGFKNCLLETKAKNRPLIVLYCKEKESFCGFCSALNQDYTTKQSQLTSKNCLYSLWWGESTQAEVDAYQFAQQLYGDFGSNPVCIGYGICEDGHKVVSIYQLKTTSSMSYGNIYGDFETKFLTPFIDTFNLEFQNRRYMSPK